MRVRSRDTAILAVVHRPRFPPLPFAMLFFSSPSPATRRYARCTAAKLSAAGLSTSTVDDYLEIAPDVSLVFRAKLPGWIR